MKRILLTLLALLPAFSALADEGMWLPSLISTRIDSMRTHGFRLTAEDVYSINRASMKDAVVLFNGGCTGELVSADGLLLTNHHCGYDAIQKHSTLEHDYLTDGFWARSREEELPNGNLWVARLVRMEEVTDRILRGVDSSLPAEQHEALLACNRRDVVRTATEGTGYNASVESLYYGNQYFLFVYETFRDVRLVAAPPSGIGKFGGDTDNWMWPRHTGDFSVFRIYADSLNRPARYAARNVPYRPAHYFPVSTRGVRPGDFTMIYGFPGSTLRYVISDEVDFILHRADPARIRLRTIRLDVIRAAQEADPAVRIQYASKHASIANSWKKWKGERLGLQRLGTVGRKQAYEARFAEWAARQPAYAGLMDSMRAAYRSVEDSAYCAIYFSESIGAVELVGFARQLMGYASGAPIDTGRVARFYRDYAPSIDREVAHRLYAAFVEEMPIERIPLSVTEAIRQAGGLEAYVDGLFRQSPLLERERVMAALADREALSALLSEEPVARQLAAFDSVQLFKARMERSLSALPVVARWYKPYLRALMAFDPQRAYFPDANLTLRVATGRVEGYAPSDGVWHRYRTTLDGILAKDNPAVYDYNVPERLRELYASKDYGRWGILDNGRLTVPVAFLASNHTTGGNSGSPVLNGRGELVGINFDRTWISTMSDIEFDPTVCRNIAVDICYVLFVLDRVGGVGYLLDEMDLR